MATKRKDGWMVVQMLLREDEYEQVFTPLREAAGFGDQTESAFLRARCGLSAPACRAASAKVSAGISSRKIIAKKRRTKTKKRSQKRGTRVEKMSQNKGVWNSPPSAGNTTHSLPFIGHLEGNEEDEKGYIERPGDAAHPPPLPEDEGAKSGAGIHARPPLDFSEELSILADILPVDSFQRKPE